MIRASGALTSAQGKDYYEREYSTGDYYTEDAHAVRGQWSGLGAQELGLEGEVDKEIFESVLEGKDGSGKLQLIPGEVGTGKHRAGWDFTCSPEKSVSIMALVGGDPGIVEDVKAANARAMVELERFALAKDRDRILETTGNLVIASFKHETSRKLDPQLHIHNVVMNMTWRGDGKFVALETREMFAAQSFVKSVFHADLAQRLKARGYAVEVRDNGTVAIRDIPQALVDEFSKRRRKDIEPYLLARGLSGAKAAEKAALRTRAVKDRDIDPEVLGGYWKATAKDQGVDLEAIRERAGRQLPSPVADGLAEERRAQARVSLAFAMEHLSERKAAFAGRELLGAALRHGMGRTTLEELNEAVRGVRELVKVQQPACPSHRFTTNQALLTEMANIRLMHEGKEAGRTILQGQTFAPARPLSDSQSRVAEHILTSPDQVLAIEGKAGAGKTYTLQAVVAEATGKGWTVRGFAPDTSAVKTLGAEAGIPAGTIAALALERPDGQKGTRPELWLVDEAGKMSSRQAAVVLGKAREAGAKVVLVGDRLQHAAVEAGKPFAYLQGAGLRAVRLDEIRRQKDEELRAAVVDASEGRTRAAVGRLEAQGKVVELRTRTDRHQAVAEDFMRTPRGQSCIVIAPSNEERHDLNQRIREALIQAGKVEKESHKASIRVSRGLTQAQKKDAGSYQLGDHLTFPRQSRVYGIKKGEEGRVAAVDPEARTVTVQLGDGRSVVFHPTRLWGTEVSRIEQRRFAVGDKIQYREAQKPEGLDLHRPGFRIANGDTGLIRALDRETGKAQVELTGTGRKVDLDLGRIQPVDHAYAITSHASQGRTEDRSLVVVDTAHSGELVNRQQFYVSISRARFESVVYTSSREELAVAVSRDAAKSSALELVGNRARQGRQEVERELHDIESGSGKAGVRAARRRAQRILASVRRWVERTYRRALETWRKGRAWTLDGGPPSRARGDLGSPGTAPERRGPADRPVERAGGRPRALPGPDGIDGDRVARLDRALHAGPGGHRTVAGRAVPGEGRPGGVAQGPAGRLDLGAGRGHGQAGERAQEPGGGDGHGLRHREALRRPGPGGTPGPGASAPGGGRPGERNLGAVDPTAPGKAARLYLDRSRPGDPGSGGHPGPGAQVNTAAGRGWDLARPPLVPAAGSGQERAIEHLRAGRVVLSAHRPEAARLLDPWKDRDLVERMARVGQGEDAGLPRGVFEAGCEACRIGAALEREAGAGRVRVPDPLKDLGHDLQTASARIEAAGFRPPFPGETLKAVPPAALRSALDEARRGGLLAEGAEWALRQDRIEPVAEALHRTLQRHLEADLQVSDPPLGGGGRR
jgi:conjugative relaxase-like TrwC/TraI family protein